MTILTKEQRAVGKQYAARPAFDHPRQEPWGTATGSAGSYGFGPIGFRV